MPGILPPGSPPVDPGIVSYLSLVGSGAHYAGIDQGIDFTGGPFDVYALDTAVITRVKRSGSGWPGEGAVLNYKLLAGPHKDEYVYVAEDFAPAADIYVGKTVPKGKSLGKATGSGKAPGIEVGFAQPSGIPVAPRPPARPASQYTQAGQAFHDYVTKEGGARPGATVGGDAGTVIKSVPGVGGAISAVTDIGSFLGRITDPAYLLRGLQIVAGAVLVLAGVLLLARQVALAADLPDPAALAGKV